MQHMEGQTSRIQHMLAEYTGTSCTAGRTEQAMGRGRGRQETITCLKVCAFFPPKH